MLIVTLVLTILFVPFGMALRLLLPSGNIAYYVGLIAEEALLWGLPAVTLRRGRKFRRRARHAMNAPMALLGGALTQMAIAAVMTMLAPMAASSARLPQSPLEWVLGAAALAVVPAICEELFFRGALLSAIEERMPTALAVVLSTLIFALMHGSLSGLPGHLVVGLLSALLLLATGRVSLCILFHLGYNGAALALAFCPRIDWLALAGVLVVAFGVHLALRVVWKRDVRAAWPDLAAAAAILLLAGARYLI